MGKEELIDLCETITQVQCKKCLLYWNQGRVYCTFGHLLRETESSRHLHQWQLDILSIPNHVIKNGRPHGPRHGKPEAQKKHFIAHNARRSCVKNGFKGIHDRSKKYFRFRDSQLKVDRTEEKCIEVGELAQKDFTCRPSPEESERYKKTWSISLDTPGTNAPMKLRSDFSEALKKCKVFTVSLEKSDSHRFLSTRIRNGIRRFLHPAHHGGNGMTTGGAHKFIEVNSLWAREMSGIKEQGDLLKTLPH